MGIQYRRLGIFGGTFNPIHIGHLRLAEDVRELFRLDRVVFIPAYIPPHKKVEECCSAFDRLQMVERAVESNDYFLCDDIEIKQGGISYTIDTVHYVFQNYQFEGKPHLIVGSDLIGELDTWKNIDRLVKEVKFIVLVRKGHPIKESDVFKKLGVRERNQKLFSYYTQRKIDVTSSEIRDRLKKGLSIHYLVPDRVYWYIKEKKLYT